MVFGTIPKSERAEQCKAPRFLRKSNFDRKNNETKSGHSMAISPWTTHVDPHQFYCLWCHQFQCSRTTLSANVEQGEEIFQTIKEWAREKGEISWKYIDLQNSHENLVEEIRHIDIVIGPNNKISTVLICCKKRHIMYMALIREL